MMDCSHSTAPDAATLPPFKRIERRFRVPTDPSAANASDAVMDESDAIRHGALEFSVSAKWRTCESMKHSLGIIEVLPQVSSLSSVTVNESTSNFQILNGIYTLSSHPGFYYLPSALSLTAQEYWTRLLLRSYIEPPNRRSIDHSLDPDASNLLVAAVVAAKVPVDATDVTSFYQTGLDAGLGDELTQKLSVSDSLSISASSSIPSPIPSSSLTSHHPPFETNIWDTYVKAHQESDREGRSADPSSTLHNNTYHAPNTYVSIKKKNKKKYQQDIKNQECIKAMGPLRRLTWSTVGIQYDWTARQYHLPSDPDYILHVLPHQRAGYSTVSNSNHMINNHSGSTSYLSGSGGESEERGGSGHKMPTPDTVSRWATPFPPQLASLCSTITSAVEQAVSMHLQSRHQPQSSSNITNYNNNGSHHDETNDPISLPSSSFESLSQAWGLPMSPFAPHAGICNLYQASGVGSSRPNRLPMGGHIDDMERTFTRPVVSLSIGVTGIYLLGGRHYDIEPIPIVMRSGDVLLLSGESRLAYHGVARVLEGTAPPLFESSSPLSSATNVTFYKLGLFPSSAYSNPYGLTLNCMQNKLNEVKSADYNEDIEEDAFAYFSRRVRININCRQVV